MSDKPVIEIRNFQPSDASYILALIQHSVAVLSPMDEQRLQLLCH